MSDSDPMNCSPPGPLSIEFSRQEYWSMYPLPSPGDLLNPRTELRSPALQTVSFLSESPLNSFPGNLAVKNLPAHTGDSYNAGDTVLIPGSGRSPWEANGNPPSILAWGNTMDRGAWQTTGHGVARVRQDLVTKPPPKKRRTGKQDHYVKKRKIVHRYILKSRLIWVI